MVRHSNPLNLTDEEIPKPAFKTILGEYVIQVSL